MSPTVSVVIPTFNRSKVIRRAMDSVAKQSYSEWECIIVDDGSTDNTKQVVEEYIKDDNRFSYLCNHRNKGAQGARNEGIVHAKGEWILLFDSDDSMHSDYLEKTGPLLKMNANIVSCFGRIVEEKTGKVLGVIDNMKEGFVFADLLKGGCYFTFNAFLVRKKCLEEIGLLDENCPSHQELDTHLRLSCMYDYCVVPEVLWDYYVGREDSISFDKFKHIEGQLYIKKKFLFDYRTKAYRSFLNEMRSLWEMSREVPDNMSSLRREMLWIAPELPLLLLKRKLKKLWQN